MGDHKRGLEIVKLAKVDYKQLVVGIEFARAGKSES